MAAIHLVQRPLIGDASLKIPPYKFTKAKANELVVLLSALDSSSAKRDFLCSLIAGYIVKDKDKLIAYTILNRVGGFPSITYLWVEPEYRRKGIGWFLVNMCILKTISCDYKDLHVYLQRDDIPAQELFRKAGFEEKRENTNMG